MIRVVAALAATAAVAAAAPGAVAPPPDTELSRSDRADVVASDDLNLTLTKAQRVERALVRRVLVVTRSVRLTQAQADPAAPADSAPPATTCRWAFRTYLQRQICFSSMTGMLACTESETIALADTVDGRVRLAEIDPTHPTCPDQQPEAEAAFVQLSNIARTRAADVFASDLSQKVEPLLKSSGVTISRVQPLAATLGRGGAGRGASAATPAPKR